MKRLLSLLLVMSLLCALPMPVSASQEEHSVPYHVLERAAQSILPEADFSPAPAKRAATYSYGIPAPLSEGQAAVRGKNLSLYYVMAENGAMNQTMYTAVYKGNASIFDDPNFDDEPIAIDTENFRHSAGLREYAFAFSTKGLSYGTYTALSFTVVNNSQIIEDTATYVQVYVVEKEIPLNYYTLTDAITGKQVKELNVPYGEERIFLLGHIPQITTGAASIKDLSQEGNYVLAEEYYGMLCLYGNKLGTTRLSFRTDYSGNSFSFRVNVCFSDQGHSYDAEVVREPGKETDGTTIYRCEHCNYAYIEHPESNQDVFKKFTDLPEIAWYTTEVKEAVEMGLFKGVSTEAFGPETTMTRAMLVTVLWRYAGKPAATKGASFTDVAPTQWYADAVAWAAENEIVSGVGKGRFDPDATVTREQIAAILYRYAAQQGTDMSASADLSIFDDAAQVSTWAENSVKWAVGEGLISGSAEHGKLYALPLEGATRAQVAAILVRAINKLFADHSYYEIELPQCEIVEKGQIKMRAWTMYEDGTLVIEQAERETGFQWDWSEHKNYINTVKVLQGIDRVDYQEFMGLPSLKEVVLADSVTSISDRAFQDCHMLKSIRLPKRLHTIGPCAFYGCTSLNDLKLPDSLQNLGGSAFHGCSSLTEIRLPDSIIVSDSVYGNGTASSAFKDCTSLTTVYLSKGMGEIPYEMFFGCTSLKTVEFAPGIFSIHGHAFEGCTALSELVLPEDLRLIYKNVFLNCDNLMSVTMLNPYLIMQPYPDLSECQYGFFPEGCEITAHLYSTGHAIAEHFGYTFHELP